MHDEFQTGLPDLTAASLGDVDDPDLAEAVAAVLVQVEKPRTNLGSSGPPGRAD